MKRDPMPVRVARLTRRVNEEAARRRAQLDIRNIQIIDGPDFGGDMFACPPTRPIMADILESVGDDIVPEGWTWEVKLLAGEPVFIVHGYIETHLDRVPANDD